MQRLTNEMLTRYSPAAPNNSSSLQSAASWPLQLVGDQSDDEHCCVHQKNGHQRIAWSTSETEVMNKNTEVMNKNTEVMNRNV